MYMPNPYTTFVYLDTFIFRFVYPVAYALKYTSTLYIIIIQKTRRSLFIIDSTALIIKVPIEI